MTSTSLEEKYAALLEFVKDLASEDLCGDAGKINPCYQSSGPYCGEHVFDDNFVFQAREVLGRIGERS